MWERRLTNAAGGNFAVKVAENRILITPSLMAERRFCRIEPGDLLLIDYCARILRGAESSPGKRHISGAANFPRRHHPCPPLLHAFMERDPSGTEVTMGREMWLLSMSVGRRTGGSSGTLSAAELAEKTAGCDPVQHGVVSPSGPVPGLQMLSTRVLEAAPNRKALFATKQPRQTPGR